jgi:hypothetical protein
MIGQTKNIDNLRAISLFNFSSLLVILITTFLIVILTFIFVNSFKYNNTESSKQLITDYKGTKCIKITESEGITSISDLEVEISANGTLKLNAGSSTMELKPGCVANVVDGELVVTETSSGLDTNRTTVDNAVKLRNVPAAHLSCFEPFRNIFRNECVQRYVITTIIGIWSVMSATLLSCSNY